jgi:hypothetical protein
MILQNRGSEIWGATWSADYTRILTWSDAIPAQIWDAQTGKVLLILPRRSGVANAIWNHDETQLLTRTSSGTELWDATTGQRLLQLDGAGMWSTDERFILTVDDTAQLWDAQTGELLQTFSHWNREE